MEKDTKVVDEERPPDRKICHINTRLLPLKLHFLLFFAGIASVLPYLPLYGKQLGISETGIGVVSFVIPGIGIIAKPFFGWLADRFKRMKLLVIILLLTGIGFFVPLIFVPLPEETTIQTVIGCDIDNVLLTQPNVSCLPDTNRTKWCNAECTKCSVTSSGIVCSEQNDTKVMNVSILVTENTKFFLVNDSEVECTRNTSSHCELTCPCDQWCCKKRNEYTTVQFWGYFVYNVFSGVSRRILQSLSDSLCYDMLGGKTKNYGKQRLWGSIGRSVSPAFAGYLLDTFTTKSGKTNFLIAFYAMIGFVILDIIAVSMLDLSGNKPKEMSESICKDVFSLFSNPKHVIFSASVIVNGVLCGTYFVYYFIFMDEIGASKLFIGLSMMVRLISEVPCFFFAGKIIPKLGHFNAVIISFVVFSGRFLSYVFIYDPRWILITEISHGFTFGFFYAAMTSYAKHSAQSGTEATFQGLLGALFDGVGMSIGNLLGGLGFEYYGSRKTFLVASITSGITAVLTLILHSYSIYRRKTLEMEKEKRISEETTAEAFDEFDNML